MPWRGADQTRERGPGRPVRARREREQIVLDDPWFETLRQRQAEQAQLRLAAVQQRPDLRAVGDLGARSPGRA